MRTFVNIYSMITNNHKGLIFTKLVKYCIFWHKPYNREYNPHQQIDYLQHVGEVYMYYQIFYILVLCYY